MFECLILILVRGGSLQYDHRKFFFTLGFFNYSVFTTLTVARVFEVQFERTTKTSYCIAIWREFCQVQGSGFFLNVS